MNFEIRTPPCIMCSSGATARLGQTAAMQVAGRKALFVLDPGLKKLGLADPVLSSMRQAGFEVFEFTDLGPDPTEKMVLNAVSVAKENKVELVVGFGGGSAMDIAKLAAILPNSPQSIQDIYGVGNVKSDRLPLILIPTTAGTGSEVTPIAIVTAQNDIKMGVVSPILLPDLAILDASLTLGLPAKTTALTGIDAIVHAIEAYTSKVRKNPMSDMFAREALALLYKNIRKAVKTGNDVQAREGMLLGASLAGLAFANSPVGAVHALAYPVGALFHVAHGLSNALVLSPVLKFNAPVAASLYAELAQIILPSVTGSAEAQSEAFINEITTLCGDIGIENRLQQVGITAADIDRLSEDAMKQTRLLVNNPRELQLEDVRKIYTSVL